jgi:integrase
MSLVKLSNGKTRVRYRIPGSRSPLSMTFDKYTEAQRFDAEMRLARLMARREANRNGNDASANFVMPTPVEFVEVAVDVTLAEFMAEYHRTYATVELSANTLATRRSVWNRYLLPPLGPMLLRAITPEVVQSFKADMKKAGVGDGALSKTLATLSAVMGKALEWGRIERNPVATVRKPSQKRKRLIDPLSPAQIEAIRAELPTEADRRFVSVLAYAGLRPGEAMALTYADVGSQTLSVTKAVALGETKGTKTGGNRSVPLLAPLAEDLVGCGPGLLFPGKDGGPWTDTRWRYWRRHVWQPAVARAGLGTLTKGKTKMAHSFEGPRPYTLRHSFASLMLAEQRSRYEVAEMLGHSPQVLESTYAHVIAELRGKGPISAVEIIENARVALGLVAPR